MVYSPMQYISTTDARATFTDVIAWAQKEPVMIRRQSKDVAVVISPEEYEKLRWIKAGELDDICVRASAYAKQQGLTDETLARLLVPEN